MEFTQENFNKLTADNETLKQMVSTLKERAVRQDERSMEDIGYLSKILASRDEQKKKLRAEIETLKKDNKELKNWFSPELFQLHANAFADPPDRPYKTYTYDEYQACCDDTAESLGEMMRDAIPEAIEEWLGENYGTDDDETDDDE